MVRSSKALVVKGSRTGLGDRVRAVLGGLIYAEAAGRSVFVDWRDGMYGAVGKNAFDQLFQLEGISQVGPNALDEHDVEPPAWLGRIHKSMDEVYIEDGALPWVREQAVAKYSIDFGKLDYSNQTAVSWEFTQLRKLRTLLPNDLQQAQGEQIERWAWRRFLKLNANIEGDIDRCLGDRAGPTIGVHIRATKEFAEEKGGIDLAEYFRALDDILRQCEVTNIFVATDNADVLTRILKRYPNAFSRPKWFGSPGDPIHLGERCPDPAQMAHDAIVELGILARCDHLVSIDNSSYSILARVMSEIQPERHVILSARKRLRERLMSKLGRLRGA